MDHIAVLRRAFHITLRHKALWVFGFFLGLAGIGSSLNIRFPASEDIFPSEGLTETQAVMLVYLFLMLCFVLIAIGLVLTVLLYVSRTALIGMVEEIERGHTPDIRWGFGRGFSMDAFKLFILDLMLGIPLFIIAILGLGIAVIPALWGFLLKRRGPLITGIVVSVVLFLGFLLVMMLMRAAANFLLTFARRECVIANRGLVESLSGGLGLLRSRFKDAGIMWLLLFGTGIGWSMVMIPVRIILLIVALAGGGSVWFVFQALNLGFIAWLAGIAIALVLFTLPAAFIQGLYQTFTSSAWTLTYLELKQSVA